VYLPRAASGKVATYERVGVMDPAALDVAVARAVEVLAEGGLLAHPTQTVYGIGGAVSPGVDRCAARMKGRDPDLYPLLRIASDRAALLAAFPGLAWTDAASALADRYWPGPLTLILDHDSSSTVAVRVEAHPVTRRILAAWGAPIGSTSLNVTGTPPAAKLAEARLCLERMPEAGVPTLLVEAGDLPGEPASTIVSLGADGPRVVREGAITAAEVLQCVR
jgi:L-threonylcarbamoyladenylate synthase